MSKVCIVTGASSGIGKKTAELMLAAGYTVYDFSRHGTACDGIRHIDTDVSDENSVNAAVMRVIEESGRVDVVVNNAGTGVSGAVEFIGTDDAKKQMDVNFFGAVNMIRAVLPNMRKQGGGRIVNISSVGAVVPLPFQAYYSASKASVNALTMALANEVRPFGISVCAVMPGDMKTGFTKSRTKRHEGDDIYGGRISKSVERMEKDEQSGQSPEVAARLIRKVCLKKRVKPLYTVGFAYKSAVILIRLLPSGLCNKIFGRMYS